VLRQPYGVEVLDALAASYFLQYPALIFVQLGWNNDGDRYADYFFRLISEDATFAISVARRNQPGQ